MWVSARHAAVPYPSPRGGIDSGHNQLVAEDSHDITTLLPRIHRKYGSHDMRTRRRNAAAPPTTPTACTCGPTVLSPKPASRFVAPLVQVLVCWSGVVPPPEGVLRVGLGVPRAVDSARVWAPPPGRHRSRPTASKRRGLSSRAQKAGSSEQAGRPLGWWVAAGPPHAHRGSFERAGGAADQGT